jgi:hypothetical protein
MYVRRNTQIYPYTIGPTQLTGVLWYLALPCHPAVTTAGS